MAGIPTGKTPPIITSPDANGFYSAPGQTPTMSSNSNLHAAFGRDASIPRSRGPTLPSAPNLNLQKIDRDPAIRTASPRIGPSGPPNGDTSTTSRPGTANGNYHERRRSVTQAGHYRQISNAPSTQIHSRDNSQAGSAGGYSSFRGQDTDYYPSLDSATDVRGGSSLGFYPSMASTTTLIGSERSVMTPDIASPARIDVKGEAKPRREHGRSSSKTNPDLRSVGEYALHHLFNSFVGKADFKINQCVAGIPETVAKVEDICGPGVDKDFDSLISALGHIARQKPKHLVDTIMYWRKAKSEEFQAAQAHWNTARASNPYIRTMQRRNTDASTGPDSIGSPGGQDEVTAQAVKAAEINVHQADRKLSLSIYLICRVLIEVYQQSDLQSITTTLDDRLEDLIFDQLHRLDPGRVEASPYHYANWTIYGQLLGVMSTLNFPKVSRRFTNVLKVAHDDLAPKGTTSPEQPEARLDLLIRAMNYVSIDAFPESRWIESCDFMCNLARFFANSHGQLIKHAYCEVIERLVFPVAATPGPQVINPRWKEFLSLMNNRIAPMLVKPKHWSDAFSLSILLLCASPSEVFSSLWLNTITGLQAKLKDRNTRAVALQSICRIVWSYLRRSTESVGIMRKLEDVVKIVLPTGKKTYLSTDPSIADPIIEFIRIIGYYFPEFAFKAIIFPLMNAELYNTNKEIKTEQLEPERVVIGIRAFLAVIGDLEKPTSEKKPPQLPCFEKGGRTPSEAPQQRSSNYLAQFDRRRSFMPSEEMLSKSVNVGYLDDTSREYFTKFCEILGKVTIVCDNTFGGQAALDEKFGGQTPKTPISDSFSFGRRNEETSLQDYRQNFYELLHVAVQALPRCLTKDIPFNPLINLLCTGTAHVQSNIAASSTRSLKAIARQTHAQHVTMGFARFIFNFDVRYSTMSDEGLLGPGHIESTLQLYLELLQIWIEEIRRKTKQANSVQSPDEAKPMNRSLGLDLTSIGAQVDELEAHGVFFLCSQSRRVRSFAISVMRLITEFDDALGQTSPRIISILESDVCEVISPEDEALNAAEKARLQKSKRKGGDKHTLIELCSSDVSYDTTLWSKIFPNLMRMIYDHCYTPVTLGREIVCARLLQMLPVIRAFSEGTRSGNAMNLYDRPLGNGRFGSAAPEIIIEQWKIYLIMACTTLRSAGAQTQNELANAQHARSKSKVLQKGQEKIGSARSLFASIIPLLNSIPIKIREAIVTALGSINKNMYRTLLESLQYAVTTCNEEARMRVASHQHQRSGSGPRPRDRRTDLLRTEVTHVYKLTSKFLQDPEVLRDEWIVMNLVKYTDDMRVYLKDSEVQMDWETQTLRKHYCGLLEEVFEGINKLADPPQWISFESRKAAFMLIEDWCGYSPYQTQINAREDGIKQLALSQQVDGSDRSNVASQMEVAKRDLRVAALSAMAALCGGPVSVHIRAQGTSLSFDVQRIMDWIEQLFNTETDKIHAIGRRALKNIIVHNPNYPRFLEHAIDRCFSSMRSKSLESYFESIFMVLTEDSTYPYPLYKAIVLVLFILGNEDSGLRARAARLLRTMEDREDRSSKIQDFDISIADKTTAVYKNAQYLISTRLTKQHPEIAFLVFSQFCFHYRLIQPQHQRNMIQAILPWLNAVELEQNPEGGPTAHSYMLLANLLEITTRANNSLHNEMQGLWSALASGPAGNVQVILDFVISLCLDRREQSFVEYAKQIVVFLSSTAAGRKVVEFLLLQISPKNMVHAEKRPLEVPAEVSSLPYVADLGEVLPIGNKQTGLALGQLSLILLVDLIVAPVELSPDQMPVLLQLCIVLWDHYTPLVQEEAREMLVHLIHELVISQIDDDTTTPSKDTIEKLVEAIRQSSPNVVWVYQDNNSRESDDEGMRVPSPMNYLTNEVINLFSIAYPNIHEQWAKTTLSWATSCSVRHLACRSFQIFRCILTSLDGPMLADMLARLSNTVADESPEVQSFSMEILTTLRTVIDALEPANLLKYPQLFWVTCACLNTVNEAEFIEALSMLDALLTRVNLDDPAVIRILKEAKPEKWEGEFEGIMPLVYHGLRSGNSLKKTLSVLNKTVSLPDSELIGGRERILFILLANLPSFVHQFEPTFEDTNNHQVAETLANAMDSEGYVELSNVMIAFSKSRFNHSKDFIKAVAGAIYQTFFPQIEFKALVFLIGLLTNKLSWFKLNTLEILTVFIPMIDMRSAEVASHGPDLISPLLRLLQTEYCPQALQVMDLIMTMNATPMEKHHLRMSMVMSGSTRSLRKEYERTQSLYGIPEETGWSVPMPAIHSNSTRINVHAVFYTCAGQSSTESEPAATPEIEFDHEESSYFPLERHDTLLSDDTRVDSAVGSMGFDSPSGDLASKLKSLDDFFDDDDGNDDKYLSRYSDMTITAYSPDPDSGANLYDEQTAPILNKSLARTASVTSLHNPYSDIRAPGVMNPGAFSSNPSSAGLVAGSAPLPLRPGLHSRSVTSPSNPSNLSSARTPGSSSFDSLSESEGERDDTVLSDDERSTGYNSNGPGMYETAMRRTRSVTARKITPAAGKEYRQGELLRGQGRLRSKSQAPGSPEVPKVPEAYLNLPKSES